MSDREQAKQHRKAILGIGIPGSGKTTYLKPLAEALHYSYVNADDIRQEVNGDARNHDNHLQIMRLFHDRVRQGLQAGGVILDATYSKRKDRLHAVDLCRQNGADEVVGYIFNPPLAVAKQRNAGRERVLPEHVLELMHSRLKLNPPSLQEGFDDLIFIDTATR